MAKVQVPVQAAVPAAQALVQPAAAPANVDNPQQNPALLQVLKGPSQPHLCFCLHARIWLLYFIPGLSKRRKITVKLLKIIKHTFRNTAYSKTTRIRLSMLY